jgi:hypothetical protein
MLAASLAIGASAGIASTATADPDQTGGFWWSLGSGESFANSIGLEVSQNPAIEPQVEATLEQMLTNLKLGLPVTVPTASTPDVSLTDVEDALASVEATAASRQPPSAYPERGSASNGYLSWNMPSGTFLLEGGYCDSNGCPTTDKISASVVTDPGAVTSRFNSNVVYFPDHGHFRNVHFETYVLCYKNLQQCGDENQSNNANGSQTWYLSSNVNLQGDKITHAFTLWGQFTPTGSGYSYSRARTGTGTCKTGNDFACTYPKGFTGAADV